MIEKHFTINKKFSSFRDHKLSADYDDMKNLVISIRKIEKQLGVKEKKINKIEKSYLKILRRATYAKIDLKKNFKISENVISFQRPQNIYSSLDPKKFLEKLLKKCQKNNPIKIKDLK